MPHLQYNTLQNLSKTTNCPHVSNVYTHTHTHKIMNMLIPNKSHA